MPYIHCYVALIIMERKKGNYKVCHPYSMSEETIGFWNGIYWKFCNDKTFGGFNDDDLQWIDETWYNELNAT